MEDQDKQKSTAQKQETVRKQIINQYIEYRKLRNLTQKDLADMMGIKRPNISRFETGQYNPTLDLLVKMAETMDLDIQISLKSREEKEESGDGKKE